MDIESEEEGIDCQEDNNQSVIGGDNGEEITYGESIIEDEDSDMTEDDNIEDASVIDDTQSVEEDQVTNNNVDTNEIPKNELNKKTMVLMIILLIKIRRCKKTWVRAHS